MKEFNELFGSLNVRMHRKQKKMFRNYVAQKSKEMNYKCKVEKSLIANNVVVGDLNKAKYVFTAHYDTPPRLPKFFTKHMVLYTLLFVGALFGVSLYAPVLAFKLTNSIALMQSLFTISKIVYGATLGYSFLHIMGFLGNANKTNYNDNTSGCYALLKLMKEYQNLPQSQKNKVAFVFFDNEEKFLLGSFAHKSKHKKNYKEKTYINFDCIGLGNQMNLYHFGKKPQIVKEFQNVFNNNQLFVGVPKKSNIFSSMSDHYPFRKANHVCLLSVDSKNNRSIFGQIHSSNDNKIDTKNIDNVIQSINDLSFIKTLNQNKTKNIENVKQLTKQQTKIVQIEKNNYNQQKNLEQDYERAFER